MFKSGRFLIYLSLSIIIVSYNFIFEVVFTSLQEAIEETLILLPMNLLLILFIYWLRKRILKLKFSLKILSGKPVYKYAYIVGLIALKAFVVTLISRVITKYAFVEDGEEAIFDFIFITVLISVLLVIVFIYFFEDYLTSIQQKHLLEIELSKNEGEKNLAKYNTLKKQLNPHFLFNSFNSLMSLISIDSKKAETFLEELSSIYRYNLSKSDELVVKLNDELEMLRSYVNLQKIRFNEALSYAEDITLKTNDWLLPPMTLQILVENAIKHNAISNNKPLLVKLYTTENSVIVENNFNPKEKSILDKESFGIGLKSIESQLRIISYNKLKIEQTDSYFKVIIPLIKSELND